MSQVTVINGGNPVTGGVNVTTTPAPATSTYTVTGTPTGTQTYNFGQGVERRLENFDTAMGTYENVNASAAVAATVDVRIRRNGGSLGPNVPFSPIYESTQSTAVSPVNGGVYNLAASQRFTAEEVLEGGAINVALADSLSNVTTGTDTQLARAKNIERIDFIYNMGMSAKSADQLGYGFLITDITSSASSAERAGVVAITGLDADGNPSSFGDVVVTWNNAPGAIVAEGSANQMIFTGNYDGTNPNPSFAADVNQGIFGRVITLGELGMEVDEQIYGFAMVAMDTVTAISGQDSSLLVDWTNTSIYALNTSSANGDLDISGGTGVIYANSDASNFVNPEPGLMLAPVALILCLFNRRFLRRFTAFGR